MTTHMRVDINVDSPLLADQGVACALQGVWNPNAAERAGAWDLLVELVTRITVVGLKPDEGTLPAALRSYADLFAAGRVALQRHGPEVASHRRGELSLATIVAHLLNRVIRPVTAWWHPQVTDLSEEDAARLRATLSALSTLVVQYAIVLAEGCEAAEFVRYLVDEGMHYRRPAD